ncbi:MAG: hypothetical protein ASARMPRED_008950 [Alectoria sarmentosa]|nr:MAG: hypothetical protein ASARMPRED_008950 [Alectoria sarmentosa]
MYSKLSIVCGLYFWLTIVSAAVNLAQIVSSNEDLQEQSTNADTDVNDVTMLNGLENAPKVTQDLAGINSAMKIVVANAEEVTPTSDAGDESSVTSSFSSTYSGALQGITTDESYIESIDESTGGALGQIGSAVSAIFKAFAVPALAIHNTSKTSSSKRKMAPGMEFEAGAQQAKEGTGQTPNKFVPRRPRGSLNYFISNTTSSHPATEWRPNASPLPSTASLTSPPANPFHNPNFKAPDRAQTDPQTSLLEATKRTAAADRKAAEYLQAKHDAEERQLKDHSALITANRQLLAENSTLKEAYAKLEKHTKNCEKATNKAQRDVKHAKGYADHIVGSQKGNLKSAERRLEEAARELKEWRDRYGWAVEKPAEEKAALHKRLSEWQSKAEKAWNEIAALKGGSQGLQSCTEAEGNQSSTKNEESQSNTKTDGDPSGTETQEIRGGFQAETKAAKYKGERDTLHRMLQKEMARNAKVAESLVLRNAKLAESLGSWAPDDGE